jgi:hypothetical protein
VAVIEVSSASWLAEQIRSTLLSSGRYVRSLNGRNMQVKPYGEAYDVTARDSASPLTPKRSLDTPRSRDVSAGNTCCVAEIELIGVPFDGCGRPGNQAAASRVLREAGVAAAFAGHDLRESGICASRPVTWPGVQGRV